MTKKAFRDMSPGTTVAYTGMFLRNAGLITGSAGLDRFVVQECHCRHCVAKTRVAVNVPFRGTDPEDPDYDPEFARDLKAEVGNTWLHISTEALYVIGQVDHRNSP